MPSYGGFNIFGYSVRMRTVDQPRNRQVNQYFGVNGIEVLDGGLAGRMTDVQGVLIGVDAATLAAVRETFRSYNDGVARTLIDTSGVSWASVLLDQLQFADRIIPDPYYGYLQPYTARFLHLI